MGRASSPSATYLHVCITVWCLYAESIFCHQCFWTWLETSWAPTTLKLLKQSTHMFPRGLRRLPQPAGERESAHHGLKATTIGQHLIPCFFYHFYQPRRGKPRLLSPTLQSPVTCSTQTQNPVMHPQKLWLYNPIWSHERIKKKKCSPQTK